MSNYLPSSEPAARSDEMLDSLPFLLARLYHGFVGVVAMLRKGAKGLPSFRPGAGSVYFALCAADGCTVSELGQQLRMPKATLTGLLNGLERDGVIERVNCRQDGRAVRVRLTRFGRSLEKGLRQQHLEVVAVLEQGLKKTEISELRRLMHTLLANLDGQKPGRARARQKVPRVSR
jgi:DNA-binding MarR family transcriptional regulator